jgi:trimethylamine corrinoid protein
MLDSELITRAKGALLDARKDEALKLTRDYIEGGGDGLELLNQAFIPAITEIGELFSRGIKFLPELILAADVMTGVTKIVSASLSEAESKAQRRGKVVIGTVEGDVHDIGKALVVTLLRVHGFEVLDLGRDVSCQRFVEQAREMEAQIIGSSALLTTTMTKQKELEEFLQEAGVRDRFKTLVGGAPVTKRWAEKIGADAYAEDAHEAVTAAKQLLG